MSTLPDWMPMDAWSAFIEMRVKAKKKPTDYAIKLLVAFLTQQREAGADPAAILDQSTVNGWQGLFRLAERRNDGDRRSTPERANFPALGKHGQATANNLQDWLEESK